MTLVGEGTILNEPTDPTYDPATALLLFRDEEADPDGQQKFNLHEIARRPYDFALALGLFANTAETETGKYLFATLRTLTQEFGEGLNSAGKCVSAELERGRATAREIADQQLLSVL